MKATILPSNAFYAIAAAVVTLLVCAGLAQTIPPFGIFLLLFSAVPIILMTFSAIYYATKEKSGMGIAATGTVAIVLAYVSLICRMAPEPKVLTLADLEPIRLGVTYLEIANTLGSGKWLSDVEAFSVSYAVEGEQRLVLTFEDGEHLSDAMLYPPDGKLTVLGNAPPEPVQAPNNHQPPDPITAEP